MGTMLTLPYNLNDYDYQALVPKPIWEKLSAGHYSNFTGPNHQTLLVVSRHLVGITALLTDCYQLLQTNEFKNTISPSLKLIDENFKILGAVQKPTITVTSHGVDENSGLSVYCYTYAKVVVLKKRGAKKKLESLDFAQFNSEVTICES
jgi:hypothetical protein